MKIQPRDKIDVLKLLSSQPGIQDIDTYPPSLEQMYRYFITQPQINQDTDKIPLENTQASLTPLKQKANQ